MVRDVLRGLPVEDYANVRAAMKDVEHHGLRGTKQIKGDIRQARLTGTTVSPIDSWSSSMGM